MPKLILSARYLKNPSASQVKNYLKYIATRPNSEKYSPLLSAAVTDGQKKWIERELKLSPTLKEQCGEKYEKYLKDPTAKTAEDLIRKIAEVNISNGVDIKNYISYLAKRPRAEFTEQGHALWNDSDEKIDLKEVQTEAAKQKGLIWNFVLSLKREDAERLGYNNASAWKNLVTQKSLVMAKELRIDPENFVWYGAFHNEGHHPHIHVMCYSKNPKEGYLTKKGIENLRREFAHEMFHDEFYHIYEQKNELRSGIREYYRKALEEAAMMRAEKNAYAAALLFQLSQNLKTAKHKKVYGRLSKENKLLVDEIVSEISKDKKVDALYQAWLGLKDELLAAYTDQDYARRSLAEEPEFRNIKNLVLKQALHMSELKQETTAYQFAEVNYIKLLRDMSRIIEEDYEKQTPAFPRLDKKHLQRIYEKKEALGMKM